MRCEFPEHHRSSGSSGAASVLIGLIVVVVFLGSTATAARVFHDLVDVVEKKPKMAFVDTGLRDEIMKRAMEIAEKVAREVIPDIAERVIREEIEKVKKGA